MPNTTTSTTLNPFQTHQHLLDNTFATSVFANEKLIYDIPEADEDILSFFLPYYEKYASPMRGLPNKPVENETNLPEPFRTYKSPVWTNWTEIWNKSPIKLDIEDVSIPELEFLFQSAIFRLSLNPTYLTTTQESRFIYQGTTFTFKGYNREDIRFVVEWLQFIHDHNAYLKVVAMTSDGTRFSYSDPHYPSFILIAPLCLVYVPTPPPGLDLYYAYPQNVDDNTIQEDDVEICWACELAF
jgi:hypothetical protein